MKESLGKALRSAREGAGISVDDAVYIGKLPRGVIHALESEDFGYFNSPLYARSFLQQYGNYVGVDVEHWLDDIEPTAMIDGDDLESLIDLSGSAVASVLRERSKKAKSSSRMPAIWLILVTGGLIYGGVKVYETFEQKHSEESPIVQDEGSKQEPLESLLPEEIPETVPAEEKTAARNEPEAPKRAIPVSEPSLD